MTSNNDATVNTTVSTVYLAERANGFLVDDLRSKGFTFGDRETTWDRIRSSRFYQQGEMMRRLGHAVVPMVRGAPRPQPLIAWQTYSRHARGAYRPQLDADFHLLCLLHPSADARVVSDSHPDPTAWLRVFDSDYIGPALGEWAIEHFLWPPTGEWALDSYPVVVWTSRGYHVWCRVAPGHDADRKTPSWTGKLGPAAAYGKDHKTKLDYRADASLLPLPGNLHKGGATEYRGQGFTEENLRELPRLVRDPVAHQYSPQAAREYHAMMATARKGNIDLSRARWSWLGGLSLLAGDSTKVQCPLHDRCREKGDKPASVWRSDDGHLHFYCHRAEEHFSDAPWCPDTAVVRVTTRKAEPGETTFDEDELHLDRLASGVVFQPYVVELDQDAGPEPEHEPEPAPTPNPTDEWLHHIGVEFEDELPGSGALGKSGVPAGTTSLSSRQNPTSSSPCGHQVTALYNSGAVQVDCQHWRCSSCGPWKLDALIEAGREWAVDVAHDEVGFRVLPRDNQEREKLRKHLYRWGRDRTVHGREITGRVVLYLRPTPDREYVLCLWEEGGKAPRGVGAGGG